MPDDLKSNLSMNLLELLFICFPLNYILTTRVLLLLLLDQGYMTSVVLDSLIKGYGKAILNQDHIEK